MIFGKLNTDQERFDRALRVYKSMRDKLTQIGYFKRLYENRRMYEGIDGGQYFDNAYNTLVSKGIAPLTINLVKGEVRTKAGTLTDNPVKVSFETRQDKYSNISNVVQDLWDYNYNRGSFKDQIEQATIDGLIMIGFTKAFLDFTHDKKMGDFGIKRVSPRMVGIDPNWITNDFKDCKAIYEESWLDPYEIEHYYGKSSKKLREAQLFYDKLGTDTNDDGIVAEMKKETSGDIDYQNGKFRVVEINYMEFVKKVDVVDKEIDKRIPISEYTEEELDVVRANTSRFAIESEYIESNKTFIFSPYFEDLILYDDYHPFQLGCLPYQMFTYSLLDGTPIGLVDLLSDPQRNINKRESAITHSINTVSNNNYFAEQGAFPDPKARQNFQLKLSTGGNVFDVASGANSEGKIKLVEKAPIPTDMMKSSDRSVEHIKAIANSTNAVKGQGEGRESALLFKNKVSQAMTVDSETFQLWDTFHKNMAESFWASYGKIYEGSYKKLNMPDGREVVINDISIDQTGDVVVINNISDFPRYAFTIGRSKVGASRKQENLTLYHELKQGSTNPLMQVAYEKKMLEYMDLTDSERKELIEYADVFMKFQVAQMQSNTVQLKANEMQAQAMIQQLNAQMQQAGQPNPQNTFGSTLGGQGGDQQDARAIAKGAGMGELPSGAGIAGRQTASNNFSNAPSDMANR